jgi:CelD/BcsL family acetyltransferase involved in cellulose biosynthesis
LARIIPAWDALAGNCPTHVFQTSAFVQAWTRTVGAKLHATPLVITRGIGDDIAAIFPACLVSEGPIRLVTWLGGPHVLDYGDILLDPARCDISADEFVAESLALIRRHAHGAMLYLTNVRDDAVASEALDARLCIYKQSAAPYIPLDGTYDEYLTSLGKKRRHNLERLARKLERCGQVDFELLGGGDERFEETARAIVRLQKTRYDSRQAAPIFGPCYERFRIEHALADPCVTVGSLRVDGALAAGTLQCTHCGRLYYLITTFDDAFAECGPGRVATLRLLESAFDSGVEVFDFGWGTERYKYEWASAEERLTTFVDDGPAGRLLRAAGKLRQVLTTPKDARC